MPNLPTPQACREARLSRDARFDGLFFVGVLTTGIYCRPVCPAVAPKEENVRYFASAQAAAHAGLRPCLRCRPESAPGSFAWKGTGTTLERALKLIDQGLLNDGGDNQAMEHLAERLGISSRYLRRLFQEQLGLSPKQYADYQRLLFAKQLLHQTDMKITDVAMAAGFGSLRRFNEVFRDTLQLTPSQLRQKRGVQAQTCLLLNYRPPYDAQAMLAFFRLRAVDGMEWFTSQEGEPCYGRTLRLNGLLAWFEACHEPEQHRFRVRIGFDEGSDMSQLRPFVMAIRRILDLDADMDSVARCLPLGLVTEGKALPRLPGAGSMFEAACRAILGQQVSVKQATQLLGKLVRECGERRTVAGRELWFFPAAGALAQATLDELRMPGSRKEALRALGAKLDAEPDMGADAMLAIKGIGPWTVNYARMRGEGDPNVLLVGDLVVRKRLQAVSQRQGEAIDTDALAKQVAPWGSYLTLVLWAMEDSPS
ncbi:AlkA N-terminal domain-containing protein [Shewanella sedimentimangrovi]|uniref:DNA-3-methyladenine glycosylase II n=1 Tax=Shewanella sedimentimangrovi TaxID=2814293 RepID=A0ABX7QZE3_9GAMM|nr:AlkA N-terminal domain-containing protein [Shewanella sedimentimangrovi]QSX35990.1 DNA-3-methyladenine glycosylase 2 family protein [Shewanella sedimentimangrovi]